MVTRTTANATTADEEMTDDQTRRQMAVEASTDKSSMAGTVVDTGKPPKVAHKDARGRRTRGAATFDDEVLARTVEACHGLKRTLIYLVGTGLSPTFSCCCWKRSIEALSTGFSEASQIAASRSMSCSSALDFPASL